MQQRYAGMRWFHHLFLVDAVLIAIALAGCSGMSKGPTISGVVSSDIDAHMEGVLVTAKRVGANISTTVVTDSAGNYSFPAGRLQPGSYALSVRAAGYELDTPANLELEPRQAARRDLSLRRVENVAAQLMVTAGDNPERLRSEASLAHLCGAAPLPASSGRTDRHRPNRGGDRHANNARHTVVLSRMSHDPRTQSSVERRTKDGLSKKEIMRCLKRYVVREIHAALLADFSRPTALDGP